jgi:transposase
MVEASIVSQCPECLSFVMKYFDGQYKVRVRPSIVIFRGNVEKKLCRTCIARFQIE